MCLLFLHSHYAGYYKVHVTVESLNWCVCVFLSALQACSRRFTKKLYKSILEWGPFAPIIAIQPTID